MADVEPLTYDDFEQELDEHFTREDLKTSFLPLLKSLREFAEADKLTWGSSIEECKLLEERIKKYDWETTGDEELFGDLLVFLEAMILTFGDVLVPADDSYELTGRLEGLTLDIVDEESPLVCWRGTFYEVTSVLE